MFEFIAYKGKKKLPVQVDLPDLIGAPLVETHAHLDMLEDPSLALVRAGFAGLTAVLTIADISSGDDVTYDMLDIWREGAQMLLAAHKHESTLRHPGLDPGSWPRQGASRQHSDISLPNTHIIVGIHPHNARHFDTAAEKRLHRFAADPRTVAIGEAGLDYYYDHSPRDVQRAVFKRKLQLAHELDLPVIIHLRDAHDDGLRILTEVGVPARGAVLHCYNRDLAIAEPFLDLGCVLGFGGPVTFKNAHEVKAAAKAASADRILIETDCPFMAPTPFRGQKCEPAHCLWVAQEVADLRDISLPELAQQTSDTAARIFRL